jgi:hypothetical protein
MCKLYWVPWDYKGFNCPGPGFRWSFHIIRWNIWHSSGSFDIAQWDLTCAGDAHHRSVAFVKWTIWHSYVKITHKYVIFFTLRCQIFDRTMSQWHNQACRCWQKLFQMDPMNAHVIVDTSQRPFRHTKLVVPFGKWKWWIVSRKKSDSNATHIPPFQRRFYCTLHWSNNVTLFNPSVNCIYLPQQLTKNLLETNNDACYDADQKLVITMRWSKSWEKRGMLCKQQG